MAYLFAVLPTVAFAQQNSLLQKYRSMALDYNHDLKAADKNIAASIELESKHRRIYALNCRERRIFSIPVILFN